MFRSLLGHKVSTVWIVVLSAAISVLWFWPSANVLAIVAIAIVLITAIALRTGSSDDRHSVEGLAAVLSCLALLLAGYWYFVDRRGIPKLNAVPSIQAWPIAGGRAFVRVELLLENVGNTDIHLAPDDKFRLEIGQVLPLAGKQADSLQASYRPIVSGGPALPILKTDKYPTRAIVKGGLDLEIESGETDRRYFKAIVPCEMDMVLAARVDVPKKLNAFQKLFEEGDRQIFWRGQAISTKLDECVKQEGKYDK